MEKTKRIRRTFSETQKTTFVDEWQRSQQSAHAFGRAQGVSAGSLIRWRDEQCKATTDCKPKMTFFPLQVVEDSTSEDHTKAVAQIIVGGLRVQVLAGAQKQDVQQLLAALQGVSP